MTSNRFLIQALALTIASLAAGPAVAGETDATDKATQDCVSPGAWTRLTGDTLRITNTPGVLPDLASSDVILLGEQHDKADDHRWQLQTLAALHALRPDMVIGFETFPRRVQPVLERWVAGELTAAQFLEQVDWEHVWGMPAVLYLPLFEFARLNRIPIVALNVDRKLVRGVSAKGWHAVPEAEREGVSRPAAPSPAYLDTLFETHREHARMRGADQATTSRSDSAFRNFVDSQTTWDRAMAEALARSAAPATGAAARPLVVGIIGSGHLRHGHGVPHQLRDLGVTRIATLLPVAADVDCGDIRPGLADAVFAVPAQIAAKPEPPRLGVSLNENERGVHVVEVTPGGLAATSGLRTGDVIVELAGAPVTKVSAVISAVRAQPPGTWLPLRVRRGKDLMELVVRFPGRA
jgi:uncharacterized iron-regulated protein